MPVEIILSICIVFELLTALILLLMAGLHRLNSFRVLLPISVYLGTVEACFKSLVRI